MEYSSGFSPEEEATIKRLLANPSVEGIILANEERQIQYTSMDNNATFLVNSKLLSFADQVRQVVRDIDPTDDLLTFRLRTREKEMIVVTPADGFKVIAIQKVNAIPSDIRQIDNEYNENL